MEQARKLSPDIAEMGTIQHTMELIIHRLRFANVGNDNVANTDYARAASNWTTAKLQRSIKSMHGIEMARDLQEL